jgi:hypothetical protein
MFSKMDMTKSQLGSLDDGWKTWSRFRAPDLLSLDHPRVRQRALKNAQLNRVSKKLRNDILVEDPKGKISVGPATSDASAVLIAEIPRSGGRWNQANFDLETFSSFFGATPGRTQRIMLTHIDSGGIPGPQEVRPGVAVKSHNYRFELEAASNLPYPSHHRPIAIFVRVATRTFRYRLLMPGTRHYGQVSEYLGKYGLHQANRVRRMLTDIRKLARQPFFEKLAS